MGHDDRPGARPRGVGGTAGRLAAARRRARALQHARCLRQGGAGARELLAITKAWELGRRERWTRGLGGYNLVVVDGPASGHGVGMLRTRRTFAEIARVGPIAAQARKVVALLEDPARSALIAVAQPAELPVSETLELEARLLAALGRRLDAVVVNGLLPDRLSGADIDRLASCDGALSPAIVTAARRRRGQGTVQRGQLRRLRRHVTAPVTTLPFLSAPQLGVDEVHELAARL